MAKNYSEIYESVFTKKNKMDFSNAMVRGNGIPLDITEVYNSLNAAIQYAATDPVAYEGQLLAVTENGDTNVYVIGPKAQGTVTIGEAQVTNYLKLVGKETDLTNYYTKSQVDALIPTIPTLNVVDDSEAEVPTAETVNVYKNLTANGHQLTEELVQVATAAGVAKAVADAKKELENEITAGMTFKGTITSLPLTAEVGDTYKVYGEAISIIVDGVSAKSGDTVIYGIDKAASGDTEATYKWYLIPSGDDIEDTWRPVTGVDSDKTLSFNAGNKLDVEVKTDGTITYSHEAINAPALVEGGTGRTYITELVSDNYGHITGYKVATETDQVIPEDTNTHYELGSSAADGKVTISLTNDDNSESDTVTIVGDGAATVSKNENGEIVISAADSQYRDGDGIKLEQGVFSADVDDKAIVVDEDGKIALKLSEDTANEGYLSVAADGLQIKGINKAIKDAVDEIRDGEALDSFADVEAALTEISDAIDGSGGLNTEAKTIVPAINEIHNILAPEGELFKAIHDIGNAAAATHDALTTETGRAIDAEKALQDAIDAIKDDDTLDSFADVHNAISDVVNVIIGTDESGDHIENLKTEAKFIVPAINELHDEIDEVRTIEIVGTPMGEDNIRTGLVNMSDTEIDEVILRGQDVCFLYEGIRFNYVGRTKEGFIFSVAATTGDASSSIDTAIVGFGHFEIFTADLAHADNVYTREEVYTKTETDLKIDEKIASVTGGESAADVKLSLESYRNAINVEIWGPEAANWSGTDAEGKPTYNPQYGTDTRIDKLEAVGAQANVIESITVEGTPLEIKNKAVDLPLASATKAGLVKSSSAENNIAVATDGIMSINSVNVNKLVQTTGEVLILNCGGAVI